MSKTLNIGDKVEAVVNSPSVEAAPEFEVAKPTLAIPEPAAKEKPMKLDPSKSTTDAAGDAFIKAAEQVPSNWSIKSAGEGLVIARNNVTRRDFEGKTSDFNKILRG